MPRHPAPIDLRLDGNEGQAIADDIVDSLSEMKADQLRNYPCTRDLAEQLAQMYGVETDEVLVTSGADDGLLRLCRACLEPGKNIVIPIPTFEMIERFSNWCFAEIRTVDWKESAFPLDAVLNATDQNTTLIAIVSPNNPTGAMITAPQLKELSELRPECVLMVDGAYMEFADTNLTPMALELSNAVIFRTFSKAFGLAGIRCGYAMGQREIIARMGAMGMPYPVSALSIHLASIALQRQIEIGTFVERVKLERAMLKTLLNELGFQARDSQGNFVFAEVNDPAWWRDCLAGLGIGVRIFPSKTGLENAIRISCPGNSDEFVRLTKALRTIASPQAILFDIDGVLADVSKSYRAAIMATARAFGASITPDDIETIKRKGGANNDWKVTYRLLVERGIAVTLSEVIDTFETLYWGDDDQKGLCEQERLIGTISELRELAGRYPLAAVTGRPRKDAHSFLERFGLSDLFSAVVTMEDAPAKPNPAPVKKALSLLGVERAWMLGDTCDDARAARDSQVLPFGVLAPGVTDRERMKTHLLESGCARVYDTWMYLEINQNDGN